MLIEQMMNKRDIATNISVIFQNIFGKDISGVFMIEDLETRNNQEFREYILSEMSRLNLDIMIFTGWAFTKDLFHKLISYKNFEENDESTELRVLIFPEILSIIVFKNVDIMKSSVKKITQEHKLCSDINIKNIVELDNGVEINYYTNTVTKLFEEKPKSLQEIIETDE
jgi:hypothetical protein